MNNANKLNNLEEIGKFLETYNLFRLYQEEIKNLDRLTTSNKIESLTIKNSHQKSPRPDSFKGEFDQIFKDLILVLLKLSQNTEEEGNFPNTFYKAGNTLTPKSDMDTTHKNKIINKASLMNIGCIKAKILNNISANGIQQYIERIIHHDQVCKNNSTSTKTKQLIYHSKKIQDKNHMIISIDAGKAFFKIQYPFKIKIHNRIQREQTSA